MGGGDAYNEYFVRGTEDTNRTNFKIAEIDGETDLAVAEKQSEAVVKQSQADLQARMYEAGARITAARFDSDARRYETDGNVKVQMEALRVREKEAELTYKVDWKNAENDAIRAEGSKIAAESKKITAESKQYKEQTRREETERRDYGRDGKNSYWYGDAIV